MTPTNRTTGGALVGLALAMALAFPAAAHEQTFMGTVASIEGQHLHITTTGKKEVMVMLHDKTKILRGKAAAKPGDIKVGERIVVITTDGKDSNGKAMLMAKEVRLAAASPPGI
jgi:hypothetical protein